MIASHNDYNLVNESSCEIRHLNHISLNDDVENVQLATDNLSSPFVILLLMDN